MISARCERNALRLLQGACLTALTKFKTTLEEDLEALSKDENDPYLSINDRNCYTLRLGEKRVLHHWIRVIDHALPIMEEDITVKQGTEMAAKITDPLF